MELTKARAIAETIVEKLKPYCDRIEIAGSIRRGKAYVHDIDIVAIPSNQGRFLYALQQLGRVKGGARSLQVLIQENTAGGQINGGPDPGHFEGYAQCDIYIATPETWATLLLIRTGSKAHNIILCKLARGKGMVLHADGRGLLYSGDDALSEIPVKCATEMDIFTELGLPYKQPAERE